MKTGTSDQIKNFIQEIFLIDEEKGKILISLRKAIIKISPDTQQKIMYGGLVFNVNEQLICGIFIRKKHISLEFSLGMTMSDPDKYLEGSGKFRRHLKIYNENDLINKKVESFIHQAFMPI